MPSYTDEIKQMMDAAVYDENTKRRGLTITGFTVESVTLTEESEKKIDEYELSANSYMQQGRLVGAYAEATQKAAENANGAANGFMGIGMMNMASGNVVGGAATGPWQNAQPATQQNVQPNSQTSSTTVEEAKEETEEKWVCECGVENPSKFKFCGACGK